MHHFNKNTCAFLERFGEQAWPYRNRRITIMIYLMDEPCQHKFYVLLVLLFPPLQTGSRTLHDAIRCMATDPNHHQVGVGPLQSIAVKLMEFFHENRWWWACKPHHFLVTYILLGVARSPPDKRGTRLRPADSKKWQRYWFLSHYFMNHLGELFHGIRFF